ncbi:MAG: glycogen/starch synthase [Bacteroidaceae bacterium]|nr:glycogen/starch synthase [Bacteroidaceae bacterium]
MKAKRILFITQEILPYVAESPESVQGRKVPQQVQEKGREARTFMPKWGTINERRNQLHEVIRLSGMNLIIDDTDHPLIIKVASIPSARMQVYFIDNDDYFSRKQMGTDARKREYKDNPERAVFYARGVLETVKKLRWVPDVVHCMGWMSAFVPLYIRTAYEEEPCFRDCSVIYTPSGFGMKGKLPKNFAEIMRLRSADISAMEGLDDTKDIQMLNKVGIKYADGVSFMQSNEKLLQLAQSLGKPVLEPQNPDEYGSAHTEFYDMIWGKGRPEDDEDND